MASRLMTVEDVADYLSISATTLRSIAFRKKHGLSVIRVGKAIRFSREEIESFVSRNTESCHSEKD